jgi:hypothetical protein
MGRGATVERAAGHRGRPWIDDSPKLGHTGLSLRWATHLLRRNCQNVRLIGDSSPGVVRLAVQHFRRGSSTDSGLAQPKVVEMSAGGVPARSALRTEEVLRPTVAASVWSPHWHFPRVLPHLIGRAARTQDSGLPSLVWHHDMTDFAAGSSQYGYGYGYGYGGTRPQGPTPALAIQARVTFR